MNDSSGESSGSDSDRRSSKKGDSSVISEKSKVRYQLCYEKFDAWCKENDVKQIDEQLMLTYFHEKKQFKASTLWVIYSMLRSEIYIHHQINIRKFSKLMKFLKQQSKGYNPKKSSVLTKENIQKYLLEADDHKNLMIKVVMIIGVAGACRMSELTYMVTENITDCGSHYQVKIPMESTKFGREFIVSSDFLPGVNQVDIVRKYLKLRPSHCNHNRLFLQYHRGKCSIQPVGVNSMGGFPRLIAHFIKLPEPSMYTGNCFRRSAIFAGTNCYDYVTTERNLKAVQLQPIQPKPIHSQPIHPQPIHPQPIQQLPPQTQEPPPLVVTNTSQLVKDLTHPKSVFVNGACYYPVTGPNQTALISGLHMSNCNNCVINIYN